MAVDGPEKDILALTVLLSSNEVLHCLMPPPSFTFSYNPLTVNSDKRKISCSID
jgi:hypothetical protein